MAEERGGRMKFLCDSCGKYPCDDTETKLMKYCPVYSPKPKPQTNGDRIRAMTDEELAEWLSDALHENSVTGGLCPQTIEFARVCYSADCNNKNCIAAWLKTEVDDGRE